MSGPIPHAIAQAAGRHAEEAQARAVVVGSVMPGPRERALHPGYAIAEAARAVAAAKRGTKAESLGASAWREMGMQTRTVLVMLGATEAQGDPRAVALQPWGSFSDNDRVQMGAVARELKRNLTNAAYLV